MEYLPIAAVFLNAILFVFGWLMKQNIETHKETLKELQGRVTSHDKDLTDVRVHYLHKDDFSEFKTELWAKLDDIKNSVKHG